MKPNEKSSTINSIKDEAYSIFTKLVRLPAFLVSGRTRVTAMVALQRLLRHSNNTNFNTLSSSAPGQWCLQSLSSSIRELRVIAGRTVAKYLCASQLVVDEEVLKRNRTSAIALLKSISDKEQSNLVETCILAWGRIGAVVPRDELNLVLIKLLDYLGSSNTIISAFAFNEILELSSSHQLTPRQLFEPFWKSLAYLVVKDMVHRPQRCRAVSELLQISVNELLLLTQTHALPWLVLDKRIDVIQKIRQARGDADVYTTICDPVNQSGVLSLLLIQDVPDVLAFANSQLQIIATDTRTFEFFEIFDTEPVSPLLELLKEAGDSSAPRQAQV